MKKLLFLFVALVRIANIAYGFENNEVYGSDFDVNGLSYNVLSQEDLTCEITYNYYGVNSLGDINYYSSYSGDIIIPNTVIYKGKIFSVISIGEHAFYGCSKLTSIDIPNSITSIGSYAFSGCSNLASIDIPNSVTSIEQHAFSSCKSLTSVKIPNNITSIGDGVFASCSALTSFTGKYASDDHRCLIVDKILKSFAPAGLTTYNIPDAATSIGNYAFSGCSSLTSIGIPNSVTSIGNYAFSGCSNLTSIDIPNSVTSIGNYAFRNCSALTSIEFPNSVTSIEAYTLRDCSSLTSVEIPNSVTSIGDAAFSYCTSLTSVEIPNSVTSIGDAAFSYCTSLTSVEIPNSVTSIGNAALYNCSSLTSVKIGNSVTSIGNNAFYNCKNLTSAEIPSSVTSIGKYAFYRCKNLTSAEIPSSVTSIGKYAFYCCSALSSVIIGESVTSIGQNAFDQCSTLTEITSLAVTPPDIDSSTFENVPKTQIVLKVPGESLATYKETKDWKEFKNIVAIVKDLDSCAEPTIEIVDNKLVVTSETEGATCQTYITSNDSKDVTGNGFIELTGIYNISAYAFAKDLNNSETATATLVWIMPEGIADTLTMNPKKTVLIRTLNGNIIITGTELGETIHIYSVDAQVLATVTATATQTIIPAPATKGDVIIIRYGGHSVKIVL